MADNHAEAEAAGKLPGKNPPPSRPLPVAGEHDGRVVKVAVEVLQRLLAKGNVITFAVLEGPDPDAQIMAVRYNDWDKTVEFRYDREVTEPVLRAIYGR